MNVYLLEIPTRRGIEPFGVYTSEKLARVAVRSLAPYANCGPLITRLIVNCDYPRGIGEAKHWHIET